ncbi:nitroreductase family protein [Mucilaginibacter segetis]|uniref:Nitroreductase n=1 Tax=Mucilaginibacter segetis TaxID=2793071 RepID=A0A934PT67_9SPHI|nr:nitroreductase [Mucilaginibacter segetis]MBK0379142.1 nitroreductase [Mucilaginibacter segetis]
MENNFSAIANTIKNRRTVKTSMMNGNKIPNGHIASILELADWAPTHGLTEPWRFVVYAKPDEFCKQHAELYKQYTPEESFNPTTYNNLSNMGSNVSHIIIPIMKRGDLPKIPAFEEIAAASCAIQNLLLGATALNIASFWSTGGMALKPAMADFFKLHDEDKIMGILYLGYTEEHLEGRRKIPVEDKIVWNQ